MDTPKLVVFEMDYSQPANHDIGDTVAEMLELQNIISLRMARVVTSAKHSELSRADVALTEIEGLVRQMRTALMEARNYPEPRGCSEFDYPEGRKA